MYYLFNTESNMALPNMNPHLISNIISMDKKYKLWNLVRILVKLQCKHRMKKEIRNEDQHAT